MRNKSSSKVEFLIGVLRTRQLSDMCGVLATEKESWTLSTESKATYQHCPDVLLLRPFLTGSHNSCHYHSQDETALDEYFEADPGQHGVWRRPKSSDPVPWDPCNETTMLEPFSIRQKCESLGLLQYYQTARLKVKEAMMHDPVTDTRQYDSNGNCMNR